MVRFTAEWWAFWAGVWGVSLTAAAALAGVVAWHFSNTANKEKDARAKALELRVSQQQERAAVAERQLLEIQERARPRTLDPGARANILESLQFGGAGDKVVEIQYVSGSTAEPHDFAHELAAVLREGGWTVSQISGGPAMGNPPVGLSIRVPDMFGGSDKAFGLQTVLQKAGLNVPMTRDPRLTQPDAVRLMVGLKP